MRAKTGFKLRPLGLEYVLTAEGVKQVNFSKMISLNESAAYLWEKVQGIEFTPADLAKFLTEQYEVDEETALRDSEAIAQKWIEAEIAEP